MVLLRAFKATFRLGGSVPQSAMAETTKVREPAFFDSPEVPQGMERCFPFFLDTRFPPEYEECDYSPSKDLNSESEFHFTTPEEIAIDNDQTMKNDFKELTYRICSIEITDRSQICRCDVDSCPQDAQVKLFFGK